MSRKLSVCALTRKRRRHRHRRSLWRNHRHRQRWLLRRLFVAVRLYARNRQAWAATGKRAVVAKTEVVAEAVAAFSWAAAFPSGAVVWAADGPLRPRLPASRISPRRRQWPRSTKTPVLAAWTVLAPCPARSSYRCHHWSCRRRRRSLRQQTIRQDIWTPLSKRCCWCRPIPIRRGKRITCNMNIFLWLFSYTK